MSKNHWMAQHLQDPYVRLANKEGYRSRASYKLLHIHQKDHLFKPGMVVVDLGAAPGGWSQVIKSAVGKTGKVFALDCLPMEPLPGVSFIQGDFSEEAALLNLENNLSGEKLDWVVSDMSPNLCGMIEIDQPRSMMLVELALEFAEKWLKDGGGFLVKVFEGQGVSELVALLRTRFRQVVIRKPMSSRSKSREQYLLAKGYKLYSISKTT